MSIYAANAAQSDGFTPRPAAFCFVRRLRNRTHVPVPAHRLYGCLFRLGDVFLPTVMNTSEVFLGDG